MKATPKGIQPKDKKSSKTTSKNRETPGYGYFHKFIFISSFKIDADCDS